MRKARLAAASAPKRTTPKDWRGKGVTLFKNVYERMFAYEEAREHKRRSARAPAAAAQGAACVKRRATCYCARFRVPLRMAANSRGFESHYAWLLIRVVSSPTTPSG